MKFAKNLRPILFVAFALVLYSQSIVANEPEADRGDSAFTEMEKSYSTLEGNYSLLTVRISQTNETTHLELFGYDYQKVELSLLEGEAASYKVPNGRIVFSRGDDSKMPGITHHQENKTPHHKVFAPKIGALRSDGRILGDYLYGGFIISEENKKLYWQRSKAGEIEKLELTPVTAREFLVEGGSERVEFVIGEDGKANKMVRHREGRGVSIVPKVKEVGQKGLLIGPQRFRGDWEGGGELAMFWSHDPSKVNESVTRAIISIHGGSRDAAGYYHYVRDISISLGVADSTIVLAPHFLEPNDNRPDSVLCWEHNEEVDWRKGDSSANFGGVSSFEILDKLVESVVNNCPNLEDIVVIGHSAGGQVATRYSSGTRTPEALELNTPSNPKVSYVVSNPSSYMYFSSKRWAGGVWPEGSFEVADSECSDLGASHYEFINPNDYMSREGLDVRKNVVARNVVYLLGELDVLNDSGLDTSCHANLQGANRLERGYIYLEYLKEEFGPSSVSGHSIAIVPNVGHDGWSMYNSYDGLNLLFDYEHKNESELPIINQYNINRTISERPLPPEGTTTQN